MKCHACVLQYGGEPFVRDVLRFCTRLFATPTTMTRRSEGRGSEVAQGTEHRSGSRFPFILWILKPVGSWL